MRPTTRPYAPESRQQGSVIVTAAIMLSLIVIALIGTELGYLFWIKRELQKATDLAAISAAQQLSPSSCNGAIIAALSSANGNGNGEKSRNLPTAFSMTGNDVVCGRWDPASADVNGRHFAALVEPYNAVRVNLEKAPDLLLPFIPGNSARTIIVEAIASKQHPQAALSIRSTLVNVTSEKAALLNLVTGTLLGGALDISVASWNGLLAANINMMDYLLALGANAGNYESVLNSRVSLAEFLRIGADLLARGGNFADAKIALDKLSVAAEIRPTTIRLGDLLGVTSGTPFSALSANLQAFGLAQGAVQLANGENALASDLDLNLLGLVGLTSKIKVIEKPQFSSIGNPTLVDPALGLLDPEKIFVRTAQIRTLHTVNLQGLTGLTSSLGSTLLATLSPLLNFLHTVTTLNLGNIVKDLVGGIICLPCTSSNILYTEVLPDAKIDISIEGSAGSAYVTGHTCDAETKSLTVRGSTSLAAVRIGKISNAFSSASPITVEPVSLAKIGYIEERYASCILGILGPILCSGRQYKNESGNFVAYPTPPTGMIPANARKTIVAGFGLRANVDVAGSASAPTLTYSAPTPENLPEIDAPPYSGASPDPSYKAINLTDVVGSLGSALSQLEIRPYESDASSVLGALLKGTIELISSLISSLSNLIKTALSPLLDPLVNQLLRVLGVDLATTEIGARLSCHRGVELVY